MATAAEIAAMRRADDLSRRALGATYPNPLVGAVVLDPAGAVVGEGWHAAPGEPHAEVVALAEAGGRARGGTVVVTLEPCAHAGRTGPCVAALLAAGVRRVVYATGDPLHGGADALRAAGTEVEGGVAADVVARTNEPWLTAVRLGRPFVTLKYAATLDGRVAAADGTSRWITGAEARADAHLLRAECDAIAVGVGTVLADDPHLTVRRPDGSLAARQPLRVVVDSLGRTPEGARVLDGAAPALLATTTGAGPAKADTVTLPGGPLVDVTALLAELRRRDVVHLLVEGGPRLAASFVDAGLVDRVVAYLAPALMGSGRPALDGGAGTPTIAALRRFRVVDVVRLSADIRVTARPGEG